MEKKRFIFCTCGRSWGQENSPLTKNDPQLYANLVKPPFHPLYG